MDYLVDSRQMKEADRYTIEQIGVLSLILMERAALAVAEELKKSDFDLSRVAVVCGAGNNGGDGLAVARLLSSEGKQVDVLFLGDEKKCSPETEVQMGLTRKYGIEIRDNLELNEYTTIIDAIFGIGLTRKVGGKYYHVIEQINSAKGKVLAVDIASGISADNGKIMGIAVKADKTVTFAYPKIGHVLFPGREYSGDLVVKDIGIWNADESRSAVFTYNTKDLQLMPERKAYSNKGSYGRILIIAGSKNMAGAAYLAAKAAYSVGCGLVKVFTAEENRIIIQQLLPEAILDTFGVGDINERGLKEALKWAECIVLGPGLGQGADACNIVEFVLKYGDKRLILDADGINITACRNISYDGYPAPIIFTPHLGEYARLADLPVEYVKKNLLEEAKRFSRDKNCICVLKDAGTIVSDGEQVYINTSGSHGMATGGSGDILAGILAGLGASGLNPFTSATLGVFLHGLAGEKASARKSSYSMLANDIITGISDVLKEYEETRRG